MNKLSQFLKEVGNGNASDGLFYCTMAFVLVFVVGAFALALIIHGIK